ncbi:type 1 fimbrial protein [Salmonella enterica]|nr:type 1 fimbrial protein [Salmonella enterica]
MKSVKHLFLLGTAMAVMSSSAFADITGTQTFTANVTANTCTIANLQQHVDLGNVQKAIFAGFPIWRAPNQTPVEVNFDVTGCGNNVTEVNVTPTFNGDARVARMVVNTGTAKNIVFDTAKLHDTDYSVDRQWISGTTKKFTLTNGAVRVPVTGVLSVGGDGDGDTITTGTLDFQMTFAFDFA